MAGHYAYTTAYQAGELTAVDISNPASPSIAGESSPDLHLIGGSNVAISGGYAFVVSKNRNASTTNNDDGNGNSLTILDIHSDPANPAVVGTVRDPNKLFGSYGIAVSGNYAYVAYQGVLSGQPTSPDTSTGGFSVINISSLAGPTIVANIDNGALPAPYTGKNLFDHSTSVAISGHYAYVTAFYSATLTVVDISNPATPQIVGFLHDAVNMAFPVDLVVQGNYAYVADQVGGSSDELTVVDISQPASPSVAGKLSNSALGGAYRIRVRGSFAYISGSSVDTISAIDISDPAAPRLAGSVADSSRLHRTTGLDLDSTGAYVVSSSPYLSTQSNVTYPPYPLQTGGPTTTGTIAVIHLDPNAISVLITPSSEPANPTSQTSASFTFSVNDAVSTVQCSLDGAAFGACTSPTTQTYSGLATGSHTFTVQATDATGNTATDAYTWSIGPTNIAPPHISGGTSPQASQVLTAVNGSWNPNPTSYMHQWEDCNAAGSACTAIPGATGQTYTVTATDTAHAIVVEEWATNGGTIGPVSSPATSVVTSPTNTAAPTISGTAAVGQTLSANSGSWSGYPTPSYTYQWQHCPASGGACSNISATGQTYTVQTSDAGFALAVTVTAKNAAGTSSPAASARTTVVPVTPANTAPPTITGTTTVGKTLSAATGSWTNSPTSYPHQWEDCNASGGPCTAIPGATGQTYTLAAADAGHTIRVLEWASNSTGKGGPATSGQTGQVKPNIAVTTIQSALKAVLAPRGKAARIPALLKTGTYKLWFTAPAAGRVSLTWYFVPKGARLTKATQVATLTASLPKAGKAYLTLHLTRAGKKLLSRARHQQMLTAKATFTTPGLSAITAPLKRFTLWRS